MFETPTMLEVHQSCLKNAISNGSSLILGTAILTKLSSAQQDTESHLSVLWDLLLEKHHGDILLWSVSCAGKRLVPRVNPRLGWLHRAGNEEDCVLPRVVFPRAQQKPHIQSVT